MSATKIRKQLREIQEVHESLGDLYLELCESSRVDPLPVVWHTFPPTPEGKTQAYVMYGYDEEKDEFGQEGFDVCADSRAELAHTVFLKVLTRHCRN